MNDGWVCVIALSGNGTKIEAHNDGRQAYQSPHNSLQNVTSSSLTIDDVLEAMHTCTPSKLASCVGHHHMIGPRTSSTSLRKLDYFSMFSLS